MRALFFFFAAVAFAQDTGVIEGVVTNSVTHAPVKKALVILRVGQDTPAYQTITDAAGHFRFDGVRPGRYAPQLTADGFVPFPLKQLTTLPGERPVSKDVVFTSVSVAPGQVVKDLAFTLEAYGAISGRVLDGKGEPLQQATVEAFQYRFTREGRSITWRHGAQTDDRGEYRMEDLRPGVWYLKAKKSIDLPEAKGRIHVLFQEENFAPKTYPRGIEVAPGDDLVGFDLQLQRVKVWRIRGLIAGVHAAETGEFSVLVKDGLGADVEIDGSFEIKSLLPGVYQLQAYTSWKELQPNILNVTVRDGDVEGVILHLGAPVVAKVKTAPKVDFGSVEGIPSAGTAALLSITLVPTDSSTDGQDLLRTIFAEEGTGRFRFDAVTPGEYRLYCYDAIEAGAGESPEFQRLFAGKAASITVQPGQRIAVQVTPISRLEIQHALRMPN